MNFNEIERVIVDLGILGQLRRNSKVSVVEPEYLAIQDHIPIITPVMRWLYGDKRGNSISKIKNLINDTDRFLNDARLGENHRSQMLDRLGTALVGLNNLEYTYRTEPKTSEQIKLIISQVDSILQHQRLTHPSPAPTPDPTEGLHPAVIQQSPQAAPSVPRSPAAVQASVPSSPTFAPLPSAVPYPAVPDVNRPKVVPLPALQPTPASVPSTSQSTTTKEPTLPLMNSSSASFEDDNYEFSDSYLAPAKSMVDDLE